MTEAELMLQSIADMQAEASRACKQAYNMGIEAAADFVAKEYADYDESRDGRVIAKNILNLKKQ